MMSSSGKAPASTFAGQQDLVALVPHINVQVFCDSQQTAEMAQLAAADRRMLRAQTTVHLGGIMGAFHAFQTQPTPNLLIVESRAARDTILAELEVLAEVCQPDTKVAVIGHVNDILLYRELIRRGISEYLVAPLQQLQFIEAIASLYQNPKSAPLGRAFSFIGVRGGVGSSTLAQNIAWAAARETGTETVIADLDLAFGTAGLNFNQDVGLGLFEVLGQPDRVDATFIERLFTKLGGKLSLLAGPGGVDRDIVIEPAAVESILTAMKSTVPYMFIDLPTVWAPWVKFALLNSDQIVLTATPDLASLRNAKSMIDMLKVARPNDALPKLVLNQVGIPKRPEISAADFGKAVGVPASAIIPFDAQSFGIAQSNGQMLFEVAPKSQAADAISNLMLQLTGSEKQPKKSAAGGSLLDMISKLRKK